MELRDHLLALLGPIAVGDELAPGVRLVGASTELGLRLTFEAHAREIHVELAPAVDGTRHAARTPRLLVAYRASDALPVEPAAGQLTGTHQAGADALDALPGERELRRHAVLVRLT